MKIFVTPLLVFLVTTCAAVEIEKPDKLPDEIIVKTLADADPRLIELCKHNQCRKNTGFKLIKTDQSIFDYSSVIEPPAVQGDYITTFPSETLFIEMIETETKPINFMQVEKNSNPEKTIVFRFWQEPDPESPQMMLEVSNPFAKPLKYNISIMGITDYNLYKTSSCPVNGKMIEIWGGTIFQLLFKNLKFLQESEPMNCSE
jgi:hypothetical protein